MSGNIKPNFSALAEEFQASRNTVKKYFYINEEKNRRRNESTKASTTHTRISYRKGPPASPGAPCHTLHDSEGQRHPNELGKAKYGAFTAFCRRKKILLDKGND